MNWTIGIVTDGSQDERLQIVLDSIYKAASFTEDAYEVIVCGNTKIQTCKVIPFDEGVKPGWITKKKNLIAHFAKYKNLILMHDYIAFDDNWFKGWHAFGDEWDVCMNPIINADGTRFRDWMGWTPNLRFIDYNDRSQLNQMYISGSYWCAKRKYMLENPLDEKLCWCQGEDVQWSLELRNNWNYQMNTYSKVNLLKFKETHVR